MRDIFTQVRNIQYFIYNLIFYIQFIVFTWFWYIKTTPTWPTWLGLLLVGSNLYKNLSLVSFISISRICWLQWSPHYTNTVCRYSPSTQTYKSTIYYIKKKVIMSKYSFEQSEHNIIIHLTWSRPYKTEPRSIYITRLTCSQVHDNIFFKYSK